MAAAQGRFAEEWAEPVELEVAPLPCWDGMREEGRQRAVRVLLREVEAEARAQGSLSWAAVRWRQGDLHILPGRVARVL